MIAQGIIGAGHHGEKIAQEVQLNTILVLGPKPFKPTSETPRFPRFRTDGGGIWDCFQVLWITNLV